jgi:hypothetical protein
MAAPRRRGEQAVVPAVHVVNADEIISAAGELRKFDSVSHKVSKIGVWNILPQCVAGVYSQAVAKLD